MGKGAFKNILTLDARHRVSKFTTLGVATAVLVTMIAIDASALSNDASPTRVELASNTSISMPKSSLQLLFAREVRRVLAIRMPLIGNHPHRKKKATTTTAAPRKATTTTAAPTTTTTVAPTTTTSSPSSPNSYPVGTSNASEPSGYSPPGANALSGFTRVYSTDFKGSALPSGWDPYSGEPGGDAGAQFSPSALSVANGMLNVNAIQQGGEWVTGGVCDCGVSMTYGAVFVRSRMTGSGPTGVQLLWPDSNAWPPEIDFNETLGGTSSTTATVHYTSANEIVHQTFNIDMTQWHTWGVIWTPTSVTYTVDGKVWGSDTNVASIPIVPMHLSLQSQTWCASGWACPTTPQSMQVDWVVEYSPIG
jgi:hypothetical protein